jgi:pimeloyl-ACP methyl ester carboxylesterase
VRCSIPRTRCNGPLCLQPLCLQPLCLQPLPILRRVLKYNVALRSASRAHAARTGSHADAARTSSHADAACTCSEGATRAITEERWALRTPRSHVHAATQLESAAEPAARFRAPAVDALTDPAFYVFRGVLRAALRTRTMWALALRAVKSCNAVPPSFLFRYRLPVLYREWEAGIMLFAIVQLEAIAAAVPGDNAAAAALRAILSSAVELFFEALVRFSKLPPNPEDAAAPVRLAHLCGLVKLGLGTKMLPASAGTEAAAVDARVLHATDVERFAHILKEQRIDMVIVSGSRDVLATTDSSRALAGMLDVPLVVLDGLGHTPAEEDPVSFLHVVRKYLR